MSSQQKVMQISELNQKVRMLLEGEFMNVWLTGEISNFIKASSGHWYFSLKDKKAQIKAAMFKGSNRFTNKDIKNGEQVLIRGRVSLYEPRGDYQLIVELMEPAGQGLLKQQYEELKHKLNAMGLFEQNVKRPIPANPKRVGVITSSTGAAVHDIITVLKRRSPQTEVIIYPSLVQGEFAAQSIINAINIANMRQEVELLIVGRGGGSLEDLWCFNDEGLAHTLYNSGLPIISAVGHEVDFSISDFVADLRAPTPSAAAELVSTDINESIQKLNQLKAKLLFAYSNQHKYFKTQQSKLKRELYLLHPAQKFQTQQQRLDHINQQLNLLISDQLKQVSQRINQNQLKLNSHNPSQRLASSKQQLKYLSDTLTTVFNKSHTDNKNRFASLIEKLQIVSPLATLTRGYSILTDEDNRVITNENQVNPDDKLTARLQQGSLNLKVIDKV